jgi:hypothetical protein
MSGPLVRQQCRDPAAAAARPGPVGAGAVTASAGTSGTHVADQPAAGGGRRRTPATDRRVNMSSQQGFVRPQPVVRVC